MIAVIAYSVTLFIGFLAFVSYLAGAAWQFLEDHDQ